MLALILLALVNWLISHGAKAVLHNGGPIYYEPGQRSAAHLVTLYDEMFAGAVLLWPSLAIVVKRVRDVGLPIAYWIILNLILVIFFLVAPRLGTPLSGLSTLVLCLIPTGTIGRLLARRR